MKALLTVPELSRRARVSVPTIKLYAAAGLIRSYCDSRGNFLFPDSAIEEARAVRDSRIRRRPDSAKPQGPA